MTIAIGSDHAGFALRRKVLTYLEEKGHTCIEFGSVNGESYDYPFAARDVCACVTGAKGETRRAGYGILLCGTGIGISIAANKMKGIRAAVCSDTYAAKCTRLHNDANVLCLGARVIGEGLAFDIVDMFLETEFEGERHMRRLAQIETISGG